MSKNLSKLTQKIDVKRIIASLSSFEALLIEVVLGLLLFAAIVNFGSIVHGANGENIAMSATWSRPRGYVFQTNTPNKTCQSDSTSCTLSSQWPGQRVDYNVTTAAGTVIYTGSVYANSSGNATPKWDWDYAAAAWPSNFSNCVNAGADCKNVNINNQTASSTTYVFNGLKENTDYKIVVCAPNCGQSGNVKLYDAVIRTGQAAKIIKTVIGTGCNGYGRVHGEFYWNRATGTNLSAQYLDLSFSTAFPYSATSGTLVPFGSDPHKLIRDDLAPNTTYYWRVNSRIGTTNAWVTSEYRTFKTPACVTASPTPTPLPAKGAALGGVIQNCRSDGKVNLYYSWTQATGADFDNQYVDWSTNSSFPAGYGTSGALGMSEKGYGATGLDPNVKIYWRVNTHIKGTYTLTPSTPVVGEYTSNCTPPEKPAAVTCQMADFTRDGAVNSADSAAVGRNYGPVTAANSVYDLYKDSNNVIDLKDTYIVGYLYTSNCIPRDYATKLINTDSCTVQGTASNIITLNFAWTPAQNVGVKTQRLYYDRNGHFDTIPANWPVGNIVILNNTSIVWTLYSAPQKADYYWFVETEFNDGHKAYSAIKAFKTRSCVTEPTGLSVDLGKYATECSSVPYGVNFKWNNTVLGAYLDVTTDANWGKGNYYNVSLGSGVSPFLTDGSNFVKPADSTLPLPLKFEPGKTYYWRIWYGLDGVWATPAAKSFTVNTCVQNTTPGLDYYILMKDTTIVPANPDTTNANIRTATGVDLKGSTSYRDNPCAGYANCWDFIIGESVKAGVSPAWLLAVMNTEGTSLGMVSDSGATVCGADFVCAINDFTRAVNGQKTGYPVYNFSDPYGSYLRWVTVYCGSAGAAAQGLCVPGSLCSCGTYFQDRVKPIYDRIAPGKLIQL